jgi:hypothetical protein
VRRTRSRSRFLRRAAVLVCTAGAAVGMIVGMTASAGDTPDEPAASRPEGERAADVGPATLSAALAATRAAASARVELTTTMPGPAGPLTLVHHAVFSDGGLRASATTDMSQVAAALADAGQPLAGDWSLPAGVVIDGDTVYAQLGPMAAELGRAPSDWTRSRLADVAHARAENDTLALVLDPLGPLDLLRHPVVEIGEVAAGDGAGREAGDGEAGGVAANSDGDADGDAGGARISGNEVHGTPIRHVRARLDLTGAAPGADGSNGGGAPVSFEARLLAAGFESLPVDVWIGGDGTVRRLALTVEGATALTTVFEVYDVGRDVTIDVPDPSEVITPPGPDETS